MKAFIGSVSIRRFWRSARTTKSSRKSCTREASGGAKAIVKAESGKLDHLKQLVLQLHSAGYDTFAFDNEKTAAESKHKLEITGEVFDAGIRHSRMEEYPLPQVVKDAAEFNSWNETLRWKSQTPCERRG